MFRTRPPAYALACAALWFIQLCANLLLVFTNLPSGASHYWLLFNLVTTILLGVLILVLPSFKNWINATMGGPAVPATIISLVFGIVVSLMFPADTTPDDVRLKHVMDDRRGTVVEKVAAAEAAAEEEEDL